MVHKGQVAGWLARGQAVTVDDIQAFTVSLDEPSVFSLAAEFEGPTTTTLGDRPADRQLALVMGDPPPIQVLVLPVQVKGRIVAMLVGDIPGEAVLAVPESELEVAAARAGVALEMLIMRQKVAS